MPFVLFQYPLVVTEPFILLVVFVCCTDLMHPAVTSATLSKAAGPKDDKRLLHCSLNYCIKQQRHYIHNVLIHYLLLLTDRNIIRKKINTKQTPCSVNLGGCFCSVIHICLLFMRMNQMRYSRSDQAQNQQFSKESQVTFCPFIYLVNPNSTEKNKQKHPTCTTFMIGAAGLVPHLL